MMISTKGRYAMRLMIDIADHEDGGPVSLKEVANREDMPVNSSYAPLRATAFSVA